MDALVLQGKEAEPDPLVLPMGVLWTLWPALGISSESGRTVSWHARAGSLQRDCEVALSTQPSARPCSPFATRLPDRTPPARTPSVRGQEHTLRVQVGVLVFTGG